MKVSLIPIVTPTYVEQQIMIGEKCIGTVKTILDNEYYKYHAILRSDHAWSVYQGFGNTVDEAMRNAIKVNITRRNVELKELDTIENTIWGDYEVN